MRYNALNAHVAQRIRQRALHSAGLHSESLAAPIPDFKQRAFKPDPYPLYPCNPRFRKKNPNFPRYIAPDFLQYLCERPEKTFPWHAGALAKARHDEGSRKAKTMKGILL